MDIHSYDTSNHVVCMCVLGWRSLQKLSSEETHNRTETCLPDNFFSFSWHPTGALEILLSITPIEEFLLAEAVREPYRITVSGLWHVNPVGPFGKTKSHFDLCNEARRFLPLLQMPANRIKKTKVFERNFEYQKECYQIWKWSKPGHCQGLHSSSSSSSFCSRNVIPSISGAQQRFPACRGQLVFAA